MKVKIGLTLLMLFLPVWIVLSQAHRPQNKAIVSFEPTITRTKGLDFLYAYSVTSATESKEIFDSFHLIVVDSTLTRTENQVPVQGPTNKKWYIDGVSLGWIGGTAASRFFEIPPENGLAPGESMTFSFNSKGLPVIKLFYAQSFAPPYKENEIDSLYVAGYTKEQLFPDWRDNAYKGITVAPHVYYSGITPPALLDTLLSYTRQSAELGWLGRTRDDDCDDDEQPEDGIVRNIEQRLQKARRELERGDSVKARRELEKLVTKVERLWKRSEREKERKHGKDRKTWWRRENGEKVIMTSEAYALLKYNTEYIIDRLPARSRHDPKRDKP